MAMFCSYQEKEEVEDELYAEDESEGSEVDSELELHLYSQLHHAANTGEKEEEGGKESEHQPTQSHDEGENYVQQLLKRHTEKSQKAQAKKQVKEVKGRRSIQEQVIVIDSSTEVITISEDDTDDGVCHVKGRRSRPKPRPLKTLIPAQQVSRRRSPSLDSVVCLTSDQSTSESESQPKSGSVSDSDGLESWMFLGGGRQREDSSIQINMEGGSHSNAGDISDAGDVWVVSGRDREAQISNRDKNQPFRRVSSRVSSRYYSDKDVTCINCSKRGHLSKNCPDPRKVPCCALCGEQGHLMRSCPSRHCMNCGLPGHLYEACLDRSYWHKHCQRCGLTGHLQDACPEIWRQYHITIQAGPPKYLQSVDNGRTPPYCYNCSRKGHFGHDCSQKRMFNGTYPSTPYINYYDSQVDFKRRNHRIQQRVRELKEAGMLSSKLQIEQTLEEPPRKKQKYSAIHKPMCFPNLNHNHNSIPAPGHSKPGQAKPWTPKNKMADKVKQKKTKPKPPKRPKPPRDHGSAEELQKKKKKKKKNKRKKKKTIGMVLEGPPELFNHPPPSSKPPKPEFHPPERLSAKGKTSAVKSKKVRERGRDRKPANKAAKEMYPADENLFGIKQKKRKKCETKC